MRSNYVPPAGDVFGQYAVKLIKRGQKIGFKEAIPEEMANPTWDDPDWCKMVVAMATGTGPVLQSDRLYRCHRCKDLGFVFLEPDLRGDEAYPVTRICDPCAFRLHLKAEWLRKQEREGTTRRGRTSSEFGQTD